MIGICESGAFWLPRSIPRPATRASHGLSAALPGEVSRAALLLGADTDTVLSELLALGAEQIQRLRGSGALE